MRGYDQPAPAAMMADLRAMNDERDRRLRGHADPDCRVCRGRGQVNEYVAPGKEGYSPCFCTGFAAYQAGPTPEIPEPSPA